MTKRPHWTTEEVLQEVLCQEEYGREDTEDDIDRDEPVMEGSGDEFSEWDEEVEGKVKQIH